MVEINYWVDLKEKCPINLKRVEKYWNEFQSNLPSRVDVTNIDRAKESSLMARANLDSMFSTLVQLLYNKEILEKAEDKILFAWLIDNLGRYLKKLDSKEFDLLIKHDSMNPEMNMVGLSRVSAYVKLLQVSVDSLIYETLCKSTIEYFEIDEEERDKKKFLYIFFQIFNITLSVMGGLSREESGFSKKGIIQSIPTTWQSLMTPKGKEIIREGYKKESGIDLKDMDKDLEDLNEEYFEEDFDDTEDN